MMKLTTQGAMETKACILFQMIAKRDQKMIKIKKTKEVMKMSVRRVY